MESIPLHAYQVVICPQNIASRADYSLLSHNERHNPCASFIVTTVQEEFADVRQAIDQGALGFLHTTTTSANAIRIIETLLSLYRVRFALQRRTKWVNDYRDQLQTHPISEISVTVSPMTYENRVMCEQTLTAIEGSMQVFRAQANDLVREARRKMWET